MFSHTMKNTVRLPRPAVKPLQGMHEVSSLCSEQSQFALHSPLATHLVPRSQPRMEARNRRTRYIIERWSPRADAVARARRLRAVAGTGPPSVVIGRHSRRPSRCLRARRRPHQFGRGSAVEPAGLSNAPRARRPAPQSMPLRGELLDAPLTRPLRLRGATMARCAGAPYGQSAGQHSSPYGHLADSAASATPPPTATSAAPLPAPRSAPSPGADSAPSRPWTRSQPERPPGKRPAFHSAVARRLARPCVAP